MNLEKFRNCQILAGTDEELIEIKSRLYALGEPVFMPDAVVDRDRWSCVLWNSDTSQWCCSHSRPIRSVGYRHFIEMTGGDNVNMD